MLALVKSLYDSPDLEGEAPLSLVKEADHFFTDKIATSQGCVATAWKVGHVASRAVLYPTFGAFGMLIKFAEIPSVFKYNEIAKSAIHYCRNRLPQYSLFFLRNPITDPTPGREKVTVKQVRLSRANFEAGCAEMEAAIDQHSWQFRKVSLFSTGTINGDIGEIVLTLCVPAPTPQPSGEKKKMS